MGKHSKKQDYTTLRRLTTGGATMAMMAIPAVAHANPLEGALGDMDVAQYAPTAEQALTGLDVAGEQAQQAVSTIPEPARDMATGAVATLQGQLPPQFFNPSFPEPAGNSAGERIVNAARSQMGTPYAWGGAQPGGFDCSGLTSWAYQQAGKTIPRTSQQQAANGMPVAAPSLGDIVSFYAGATHVGIFSGNGNVIHAPQEGDVVKETPMNYMPVHNIVRY